MDPSHLLALLMVLALAGSGALVVRRMEGRMRLGFLVASLLAVPLALQGSLFLLEGLVFAAAPVPREVAYVLAFVPAVLTAAIVASSRGGLAQASWRPVWWASPVLMFLLGTPAMSPHPEGDPVNLLLGLGLLLGATMMPAGIAFAVGSPRRLHQVIAVPLLALLTFTATVGGASTLETYLIQPRFDEAEHVWVVALTPSDAAPYEVRVPSPRPTEPRAEAMAQRLLERIEVHRGQASFRLEGQSLVVQGSGEVGLRAVDRFVGPVAQREAFLGYNVSGPASLAEGGPAAIQVNVLVDFSGGEGHTCWWRGETLVPLGPGDPAPLDLPRRAECE